jgi:methyl-accepting chemotaxis protein
MAGRVLTRDLDSRLKTLEERIEDIIGHISLLDEQMRQSHTASDPSPAMQFHDGNGDPPQAESDGTKLAELEASVARLDQRVEKIASTIVAQSTRWT